MVMQILLGLALISVPIMLYVKPIYENSKNHKSHSTAAVNDDFQNHALNDSTDGDYTSDGKKGNTV